MSANDKGCGLNHPKVAPGPLHPFNERTRLKLLVSTVRHRRYRRVARLERELARSAAQ